MYIVLLNVMFKEGIVFQMVLYRGEVTAEWLLILSLKVFITNLDIIDLFDNVYVYV